MEDTCSIVSKSLIKVHKEVIEHEQDFFLVSLVGALAASAQQEWKQRGRKNACD